MFLNKSSYDLRLFCADPMSGKTFCRRDLAQNVLSQSNYRITSSAISLELHDGWFYFLHSDRKTNCQPLWLQDWRKLNQSGCRILSSAVFIELNECVERHIFRIVGVIRPKLCGNCAFPQNFHTRKLGEITVFFTVYRPKCALVQ